VQKKSNQRRAGIALFPIRTGIFNRYAITKRSIAAIKTRIDRNTNGSAYGNPYLAPTNPVLHNKTKSAGANRANFNPRRSPSGLLEI
jgi:hypothetical protein